MIFGSPLSKKGRKRRKRVFFKNPRGSLSPIQETYYIRGASGNIMATYTLKNQELIWNEAHIYGSSRLGVEEKNELLHNSSGVVSSTPQADEVEFYRGKKRNELSNHLGNPACGGQAVLTVITDRKIAANGSASGNATYYQADIVSVTDYYPFGMQIKERSYVAVSASGGSAGSYRYGFNGMEKDDEVSGEGNSYTTEFRQLDVRLGRWLSIDPKAKKYPNESPFLAFHNNPMLWTDPRGDDPPYTIKNGELQGEGVKLNITSETFRPKMKSINAIVLHRTVSSTAESAIRTTKNNKGHTGFHVVIDKDGTITQVNNFENRANHVGQQKGTVSNLNSIGIEIVGMPIDKDGNLRFK